MPEDRAHKYRFLDEATPVFRRTQQRIQAGLNRWYWSCTVRAFYLQLPIEWAEAEGIDGPCWPTAWTWPG